MVVAREGNREETVICTHLSVDLETYPSNRTKTSFSQCYLKKFFALTSVSIDFHMEDQVFFWDCPAGNLLRYGTSDGNSLVKSFSIIGRDEGAAVNITKYNTFISLMDKLALLRDRLAPVTQYTDKRLDNLGKLQKRIFGFTRAVLNTTDPKYKSTRYWFNGFLNSSDSEECGRLLKEVICYCVPYPRANSSGRSQYPTIKQFYEHIKTMIQSIQAPNLKSDDPVMELAVFLDDLIAKLSEGIDLDQVKKNMYF